MRIVRIATTQLTKSGDRESTKRAQTIAFKWTGNFSNIKPLLAMFSIYARLMFSFGIIFFSMFYICLPVAVRAIFQVWTVTQLEWKIEK